MKEEFYCPCKITLSLISALGSKQKGANLSLDTWFDACLIIMYAVYVSFLALSSLLPLIHDAALVESFFRVTVLSSLSCRGEQLMIYRFTSSLIPSYFVFSSSFVFSPVVTLQSSTPYFRKQFVAPFLVITNPGAVLLSQPRVCLFVSMFMREIFHFFIILIFQCMWDYGVFFPRGVFSFHYLLRRVIIQKAFYQCSYNRLGCCRPSLPLFCFITPCQFLITYFQHCILLRSHI